MRCALIASVCDPPHIASYERPFVEPFELADRPGDGDSRGDLAPLTDAAAGAPDKMLPATLGFTHRLGIAADIVLPGSAARVFALDGRGQRVGVVAISAAADASLFSIGPPHRTLWYEIDRL